MTQQKTLPEKRMDALVDLHINPTHKLRKDESPYFLLYLNYAVNNICDITGISPETSAKGVVNSIKGKGPDAIRKLANFFWLFNEDDPSRDFPCPNAHQAVIDHFNLVVYESWAEPQAEAIAEAFAKVDAAYSR